MDRIFKTKPQGKINVRKILEGMMLGKKKIDIAVEAGSEAKSDQAKCNAVNQVMGTDRFKKMSEKLIDKLDNEVNRLADNMMTVNLDSVEYKDKSASLERLKKLSELLKGGATDRTEVDITDVKRFLDNA